MILDSILINTLTVSILSCLIVGSSKLSVIMVQVLCILHLNSPSMQSDSLQQLTKHVRKALKPQFQRLVEDHRIEKFLSANNKNALKTATALQGLLEYERETKTHFTCSPQQVKSLKQAYPHAFSGVDREGRPVYIELIGSIKINDLFKLIEDQTLVSYFVQRMSYLYGAIFPKVDKKQLLVIIDLKGQLTKIVTKRTHKIVNQIVTVGQNFYPETLYKVVFVNTPMTWDSIWSSIKEEIEPSTLKKIEFLGSDYQSDLFKMVDPKYLPECLGGQLSQQEFLSGYGLWQQSAGKSQKEDQEQKQDSDEEIDFGALKALLSKVVPAQHQVRRDVANTPLNTEADDFS